MASRTDKDEVIESAEELDTKQQKPGSSAKFYGAEGQCLLEDKKEIESLKALLEKQSKEKENDIKNLQKEAAVELETHTREMQSLKFENLKLNNKLASCKDARTELNKMMTEKEEVIKQLQNDNKIERERAASVEQRFLEMVATATAEKNELKLTKTKLNEKVKETEQSIKLLQSEINALQKEIAEKQTQNDVLSREKLENEPLAEIDPNKKDIRSLKNLLENNLSLRILNEVELQSNLSNNSTFLVIEDRTINYVAPGTVNNLSSLTQLEFQYCGLTFLEKGVFNNLTNLIILNLRDNHLTCLEGNVFAGLKKLKYISLYLNNITKFPPRLFRGLESLEKINLGRNKISVLDEDLLVGLNRLTCFIAFDNNLTSIPEKLFGDCVKLETIWLQNNKIVRLKKTIFNNLHNLKELYLHNNPLNEMDKNELRMLTIEDFRI